MFILIFLFLLLSVLFGASVAPWLAAGLVVSGIVAFLQICRICGWI